MDLWINSDTLRTQCDVSNLYRLKLLGDEPRSYVEVGGGYGRLAHAILVASPKSTYTVIDFPEVLDIVKRWIAYVNPEIKILTNVDSNQPAGSLRLIANNSIDISIECDVLVNINSFCEMTDNQVISYVDSSQILWNYLYSNNRNRQFMNFDLKTPLVELLERFGTVWPNQDDYMKLQSKGIVRSVDAKLVTLTTKSGTQWKAPISPAELDGLAGTPMPGL